MNNLLVCVAKDRNQHLTIGKVYKFVSEQSGGYHILDDVNYTGYYYKYKFIKLEAKLAKVLYA